MGYWTQTQPRQVHPKSGKLEFKIVRVQGEFVLGQEQQHFSRAPSPSQDHCWHPPAEEDWTGEG